MLDNFVLEAEAAKKDRQHLMTICFGDSARFERLIELAQSKVPHASRKDLIRIAIEGYIRDNR